MATRSIRSEMAKQSAFQTLYRVKAEVTPHTRDYPRDSDFYVVVPVPEGTLLTREILEEHVHDYLRDVLNYQVHKIHEIEQVPSPWTDACWLFSLEDERLGEAGSKVFFPDPGKV